MSAIDRLDSAARALRRMEERLFALQVRGAYGSTFGLAERFACAKMLEVCFKYLLSDQTVMDTLLSWSSAFQSCLPL